MDSKQGQSLGTLVSQSGGSQRELDLRGNKVCVEEETDLRAIQEEDWGPGGEAGWGKGAGADPVCLHRGRPGQQVYVYVEVMERKVLTLFNHRAPVTPRFWSPGLRTQRRGLGGVKFRCLNPW